jgi:hypothetical protein
MPTKPPSLVLQGNGSAVHSGVRRRTLQRARKLARSPPFLGATARCHQGSAVVRCLLRLSDRAVEIRRGAVAGASSFLPILFDVEAVLLARGTSQVRGRAAITNVIISQLRHGGSYVAAPQLVMHSGPLALIISGAAISVARRNLDGWHYVISRLDL